MPELPEAEVVARQVRVHLIGATLADVWIGRDDIVREGLESRDWYPGARLIGVERRGKSVVLVLARSGETRYVVAELGMTGLLLFPSVRTKFPEHVHVRMTFAGGSEPELRYWNPRRFGRVSLMDEAQMTAYTDRRFGPDPLAMTWEEFWSILRVRRGRLKSLLMNQRTIAGIGNIYANEILFRAGLHPNRPADRVSKPRGHILYRQLQGVLTEAIQHGGSSVRDFLAPDGSRGRYTSKHLVYNHARKPCPSQCGASIRALKSERMSFYCPRCQRA